MERDFLGLNSKDSLVVMDEEVKDEGKDTVFMRGSGMQWPSSSSNKVSALPQFMPYKTGQEERSKKTVFDPLASSGFMPISTADVFDTNHKTFNGVVQQKNFSFDRQGSSNYGTTAYPVQHIDTHLTHRSQENGQFYMNNPFFKAHVTTNGRNFAPTMRQQPLGGIPITSQHSYVQSSGSMVGTVDQRNVSKSAGAPTQLTIFYGGSVNVYDNISPEKAQAIMYSAGNGNSMNPNMTAPRTQVQAFISKPTGCDGVHGNQSHTASPCSGLSSPISVTSNLAAQSGSGSSGTDELMAVKPIGALTAPSSQSEPPKSLGSAAATMVPAAVPQARQASLARFLEKRKERVMSTMPYNMNDKLPDCSIGSVSNGTSLPGNTGLGSGPGSKEQSWSLVPTKNASNNESLH